MPFADYLSGVVLVSYGETTSNEIAVEQAASWSRGSAPATQIEAELQALTVLGSAGARGA